MRNLWAGAALAVLVVLASGCAAGNTSVDSGTASPLKLELSIIGQPMVNNTFTLVAKFGLMKNFGPLYREGEFDDSILWLVLPDGVDVVSGPTNWTGRIDNASGESLTLNSQLVITKEGGYQIEGFLKGPTIGNNWFGDHETIFIESSALGYITLPYKPISTNHVGYLENCTNCS